MFGGLSKLAAIQYHGDPRATDACVRAIARLIQGGELITRALLLSCDGIHAYLLEINEFELVAIKAGFRSGYGGEGPKGLATSLQILKGFGVHVEEVSVSLDLIERLDQSHLRAVDVEEILKAPFIRPLRWYDYIFDVERNARSIIVGAQFPSVLPYRIVDSRLGDLALKLRSDPDSALMAGYRRLEELIRKRSHLPGLAGAQLFAKAFQADDAPLGWRGVEPGEAKGRAMLFFSVFMAHRNRRAHNEMEQSADEATREFLLLNELFLLEAEAEPRKGSNPN